MPSSLVIAAAQPECLPYDVAANAAAHAAAVRAADARVVVFPEMSLTGYHLDAPVVGPDDPRLAPIVAACAETGTIALAGAPTPGSTATGSTATGGTATGEPWIGVLAIDGSGARVVYGKVCLHGTEAERFGPGEPAVIEVDGWRLGLAVCRDTGIPEHARRTAELGIDAYLAGVVHHDHEAHVHGERARRVAADHRVPVVTAAFAGGTGGGFDRTSGGSGIWSADGDVLAQAGVAPGEFARAVLTR
ncbi:carbon-nitrogen hydrolase family protein [Actinoplanes sp. DH11]|uniref:carbon-nitrogen hydrolase family protein n=1 Tax=Actinoplanes sp. DH11 TaxID=2857011 RepID=UPI001E5A8809|nr:carbon-nitrogen hydrolase family protein [Actinoplanes sp. DH11]